MSLTTQQLNRNHERSTIALSCPTNVRSGTPSKEHRQTLHLSHRSWVPVGCWDCPYNHCSPLGMVSESKYQIDSDYYDGPLSQLWSNCPKFSNACGTDPANPMPDNIEYHPDREVDGRPFVMFAYPPAPTTNIYDVLVTSSRRAKCSDDVVVLGDLNAKLGRLLAFEAQMVILSGFKSIWIYAISTYEVTEFVWPNCLQRACRPPTKLIASASVTDDADHKLTDTHFKTHVWATTMCSSGVASFHFLGRRQATPLATERLTNPEVRQIYQNHLLVSLPSALPSERVHHIPERCWEFRLWCNPTWSPQTEQ
ncbi:LOW QUALITY PROTEIN: hypothetical protein T265_13866 [Opisthorchis viverrini]|uniref:Endonuclease/exonuclease/phosphatase domain-containing protein n=1 Tax=Opisthorchis viverrini TaxID=6198 RepID=A0A075AEV6_OPIVI|nr:LOW QUALITY PROTEIN: hypothetical protein T265_13866 [Opisthorchis viverrini]KER27104.1 LOW QUALITY PROTEIN: hypothetical protein T265_13866 [Opisthorchis viverrini]